MNAAKFYRRAETWLLQHTDMAGRVANNILTCERYIGRYYGGDEQAALKEMIRREISHRAAEVWDAGPRFLAPIMIRDDDKVTFPFCCEPFAPLPYGSHLDAYRINGGDDMGKVLVLPRTAGDPAEKQALIELQHKYGGDLLRLGDYDPNWNDEDVRRSCAQGWSLFTMDGGVYEIQRIDTPEEGEPPFANDDEAIVFVLNNRRDCPTCAKAIKLHRSQARRYEQGRASSPPDAQKGN